MAASYPTSIVALSTKNDGDTISSSHVDALQDETIAVETGLLNGFQHNVKPLNDNSKDLGDASHAWANLWTKGTVQLNGITYTFPVADGLAAQVLGTNGSKVLSWLTPPVAMLNDFRLSLTSGTSVTVSDVLAATTLYFTPHGGRRVAVFDGSGNVTVLTSAEISIAVPATTSQMYDVFVYNNSGTLALELLAWTNDTTRATAILKTGALDAAGVYTKSGDTTRRYVATVRTTTVSGQTEDSAAKRYVYNHYNRMPRPVRVVDSTTSWTYNGTYHQANANAANQVDVVVGVAESVISLTLTGAFNVGGTTSAAVAIGEDSTTTRATECINFITQSPSSGITTPLFASLTKTPAAGRHFYAWLEQDAANSTFYGTNGSATTQNGLVGTWWS